MKSNFVFILALFMVLLCCFSTVSASENVDDIIAVSGDVAVDDVISEVDSGDESISVNAEEQVIGVDNTSALIAQENNDSELASSVDFDSALIAQENNEPLLGLSTDDVLGDRNSPAQWGQDGADAQNTAQSPYDGIVYFATDKTIYGTPEDTTITGFTGLKEAIDANDVVNLFNNVNLEDGESSTFKNGIEINKNVTINGNNYIVNGTDLVRIFNIKNSANVVLKDLVIAGGYVVNNHGAGVYVDTGSLTVENCTFIDNAAMNTETRRGSANGGAIYAKERTAVNIKDSLFESNMVTTDRSAMIQYYASTQYGGAIYCNDYVTLTVTNSTFKDNKADRSSYSYRNMYGGAIFSTGANSLNTIANCTFINNTANDGVGAVHTRVANITGCVFDDNYGTNDYPAVYYEGNGKGSVSYNVFLDNTTQIRVRNNVANVVEEYNWWATNEPGQLVRIENTNQVPNKFIMMDVTNKGKTVKAGFMKDSNREDIPNVELLPVRDAVFVGDVDNLNARTTGGLATVNYVQSISEESIINVTIDGYTITYALGEGNITGSDVISVEGTNVGSNGTITIQFTGDNGPVDGTVSVLLNDTEYTANVVDSVAVFEGGDDLDAGIYDIYYEYLGGSKYVATLEKIKDDSKFEVKKADVEILFVNVHNVITVNVSQVNTPTGTVNVTVGEISKNLSLENGVASYNFGSDITEIGIYDLKIIYSGDSNHNNATLEDTFEITKSPVNVTFENVPEEITTNIGEYPRFEFNITCNNESITTGSISFDVGESGLYTEGRYRNGAWYARFQTWNANPGEFEITLKYDGDGYYLPYNTTFNMIIRPTVVAKAVSKDDKVIVDVVISDDEYYDSNSFNDYSPISDAGGSFRVMNNNETLAEGTIEGGIGSVTFNNLEPGKYELLIVYLGDDKYPGNNGTTKIVIPKTSQWGVTGHDYKNSGKSNYTRSDNVAIIWANDEIINFTKYSLRDDFGKFLPSYSVVIDSDGIIYIADAASGYALYENGTVIHKMGGGLTGGLTLMYDYIVLDPVTTNTMRIYDSHTLENLRGEVGWSTSSRFPNVVGPDGRAFITSTYGDNMNSGNWIVVLNYDTENNNVYVDWDPQNSAYYQDSITGDAHNSGYSLTKVINTPVFTDDGVMWVSTAGSFGAADTANNGAVVFSTYVGVSGRPVVDEANIVYYLGVDNTLYALTLDGYVWNTTVSGNVGTTLAVGEDYLYAVNANGTLYKYAKDDGAESIVADLGSAGQSIILDANDNVYISTANGDVFAFDSEDNELWTINLGSAILGQLAMNEKGIIYAFTADTLYAIGFRNETDLIFEVDENFTTLDNITFTANINSTIVDENIIFTVMGIDNDYKNSYNATIDGGVATWDIGNLPSGNYTVTASYAGNTYYTEASISQDFKVSKVTPELSVNINNATVFENATITVTSSNCEGNVTVKVGDDYTYENVVIGEEFTLPLLPIGIYDVTVTYVADDIYAEAVNDTEQLEISKADAVIIPDVDAGFTDATVTLTFPDGAEGTVYLDVEGIGYYAVIENDVAVINVVGLEAGEEYPASVFYTGDDNYNNQTFDLTIKTEDLLDAELELTVDDTIISVSIDDGATGMIILTVGDISFVYDAQEVIVLDASAYLGNGTYDVSAIYEGDGIYSADADENKVTIPEKTLEDPELDVSVDGTDVTVSLNENATGYVVVSADGKDLFFEYDGEPVVVDFSDLEPGNYTVEVTYSGDDVFASDNASAKLSVPEVELLDSELKVDIQNTTVTVSINENATGDVIITVGDISFIQDADELAPIDVSEYLTNGTYPVTVKYVGDDVFAEKVLIGGKVTVPEDPVVEPKDPNLKATALNSTVTVTVDKDATGNVLVDVDGQGYYAEIKNGKAVIDVIGLDAGTYKASVIYLGDDVFASANTTVSVTVPEDPVVEPKDPNLKATAVNSTITVTVDKDATGDILVDVDGQGYYAEIKNGKAVIDVIGLDAGTYKASVIYLGDDVFASANTTVSVTVPEDPVVEPKDPNLKASAVNSTVTVTVDKDATGDILVDVDGQGYYAEIKNGKAVIDVIGLDAGTYKASVIYLGDDVFASANTTVSVTVPEDPVVEPKDPNLKASAVNSTVTVTVDKDATGNVLVDVGGQGYYAAIKNGKAVINVIGLDEGKYDALVTYLGDDVFASANATVSVTVPKKEDPAPEPVDPKADIKITNETVSVNLPKDATGYVLVDVDGTGYYVPVKDGKASFDLPELAPGNHTVAVTYTGDKKYDSANATQTIDVVSPVETIVAENLTKIEKAPDKFVAKFSDKDGKALANTKVTFAINGGTYTRTTDANGEASFAINLAAGTYTMVTTNPVTGDTKENSITVLSRFAENKDVTKYFRNATQYVVKVLGDDGKPAVGEVVTFNINGVFYNRTVNASGYVKMNINLNPGDYVITAEYKGCKVSNNIKVLPVLTGKDLTKKFGEPGQFEATLVDGQGKAYANQKISFNINGVFYERTTNANGIAKLNINLQPGVYIITSTYGQAAISNKVTVTA